MNSFEYSSTDTDQLEVEHRNTETVSPEPLPISVSVTIPQPAPEPSPVIEEEKPVSAELPKAAPPVEVESFTQLSNELTYSCLLLPRFSDHYLSGDIVKDLELWVKEVCISYGWRLNSITIRPGYLHWLVTVPMTSNPSKVIKVTCQQTSQKICEYYPRFKRQNLSLDFWAPGFSVVPGNAPHTMETINNFILQIRRQQGII